MPLRLVLPGPVLVCVGVGVHVCACVCVYWGPEERALLTVGRLGGPREVNLSWVAVAGNDDWLFHHIDAVALHQILKEVEYFLGPGALECKYP